MSKRIITYTYTWAQTILANILKQGPLPKHVAFIMDGNRRFAKRMNYASATDGHRRGDDILTQVIEMGRYLGIPEISVYAFSTENLKRSKEEVDGLMALFTERALKLEKDIDTLMKHDIRIDVVGDYKLASTRDLRKMFAKVMSATKNNTTYKINVCFAYTGRAQIAKGLTRLLTGLNDGQLYPEDVSEALLERVMTSGKYRPVDILIRTSGETRLSDFMMWEASNAYIQIIDKEWPAFSFRDFLDSILNYQVSYIYHGLRPSTVMKSSKETSVESMDRQNKFVDIVTTRVLEDVENDL